MSKKLKELWRNSIELICYQTKKTLTDTQKNGGMQTSSLFICHFGQKNPEPPKNCGTVLLS